MLRRLALAMLLGCGCHASEESSGAGGGSVSDCPPGERAVEGHGCLPAGVQDSGCHAGEVTLESGDCAPAGIPPEACAAGFEPDEDGCVPILPRDACGPGEMAVPGETRCRPVAPCGSGKWGDIPVESNTQYVDLAYAATDSDGSALKPWKTIASAYVAADAGAIIAVAAGSYDEDIEVVTKPVRIWGVCPDLVAIVGTGAASTTVSFYHADGSEIHDVAVSGPRVGVGAAASDEVIAERVWIHDTGEFGAASIGAFGPAGITLRRSLIESADRFGVYTSGATVSVDGSVVRDTQPYSADLTDGAGIRIDERPSAGLPGRGSIRGSVIVRNRGYGIQALGSNAIVEGSVIQDTLPQASDMDLGVGINAVRGPTLRSNLEVRASFLSNNRLGGIGLSASDGTFDATVIAHTQPDSTGGFGRGMNFVQDGSGEPSVVTIKNCVLRNNSGSGIVIDSSDASIEGTVVRDRDATSSDTGRGIEIVAHYGRPSEVIMKSSIVSAQVDSGVMISGSNATFEGVLVRDTQPRANAETTGLGVTLQLDASALFIASVFETNHTLGMFIAGADAVLDASVVRDTQPNPQNAAGGPGIQLQRGLEDQREANMVMRDSLIDRNVLGGVLIFSATATIEHTLIRDTTADLAGILGDGLSVLSAIDATPATALVMHTRIENSARAGVSNFGGDVGLEGVQLECNTIALASEVLPIIERPSTFDDRGNNLCGCGEIVSECKAISSGLEPPEPL